MAQDLKQVPYGEPSFVSLRGAGYAYVDKTHYIQTLEECGTRFPFIVRPRRFGKSVFANTLMAYYDKAAKDSFAKNFAGTWISEHPTPLANKYLVLKFDFSGVGTGERLIENFIRKVRAGAQNFADRYLPNDETISAILDATYASPESLFLDFLYAVRKKTKDQIYLIIDEYDQFAQEVLSSDPEKFRTITGSEGFLKIFYENIKDASQDQIDRVFITGVTSISLDSMTSGFNIATNFSNDPAFVGIMGFTDAELRDLIPQIIDVTEYGHSVDEIFDRMKILYDGYRFSPNSDITVFNSSMCLYYLNAIVRTGAEPETLLDPAFSVDLTKLNRILSLGNDNSFVLKVVEDVLFDRPIKSKGLSSVINLNAATALSNRDILTALVFMGFLTFSSENAKRLICPNHAVKDLFFQYWFWNVEHFEEIDFSLDTQKEAISALMKGDIQPLLDYVTEALGDSVGVHALSHLNETSLQMAVNMAINTNSVYKVTAEEEALGAGFTDLLLRPNERYRDAAAWLMEFKYLKKSDATPEAVETKIAEAEAQLERYVTAENIANIPNLHRAAVVFSGVELKGVKVL